MNSMNVKILLCFIICFSSCSSIHTQETEIRQENIQENETVAEKIESSEVAQEKEEIVEEAMEKPVPEYLQIVKDGDNLVFENVLNETAKYIRYHISYTSEGLKISGIMNIPKEVENAPLLILNHGYIDPAVYTLGRGLKREQDYFANNGFAVLHTDYRNHAFSDTDTSMKGTGIVLRSKKYGADAINAILAVGKARESGVSEVQSIDTESIGMLGHSMGGGVTMYGLVAEPDLIDAAVLYAPVHSDEFNNFQKWTKKECLQKIY